MSKRRSVNGSHVRLELTEERCSLPKDINEAIQNVFVKGIMQTKFFLNSSSQVDSKTFSKEEEEIEIQSLGNKGVSRLLFAIFLFGIYRTLKTELGKHKISTKTALHNMFVVAAMANNTLTHAMLLLTRESNYSLLTMNKILDSIGERWWAKHFSGSMAVARLAHFLLAEGMLVYLPKPCEDIHWKIDLIAKVPASSVNLCFQVKADESINTMWYKIHSGKPEQDLKSNLARFLNGVEKFQDIYKGSYVPIEATLGSKAFDRGCLQPTGYIIDALNFMIQEASGMIQHAVPDPAC
jgi:hypothetical protein